MAKKLDPMDLKQIIQLHLDGLSNRSISQTLSISRNTINTYMQLFGTCDKSLNELLMLSEADLLELFSNKTTIDNDRYKALMDYFEKEKLAVDHTGFTFQNHYFEYKFRTDNPYSYTQFLEHYHRKYSKLKGSMKLNHKAGHEMMIDFAGKHLHVVDKESGELIPTEVFVAILPFSQYTYVESCMSQKREDLISCTANALSFYGGVPKAIVSDNLKSAVTRSSKYEPQINKSLKDFAHHYGCVINPTRTYSPQDKALVENAVNLTYQRIYYPLRNMTFFSLRDLNKEIKRLLEDYNDVLFQRKEASRKELFQSIERGELKQLPSSVYELKDYRRAKVQQMGYVYFSPDKSYYSVPYRFIGRHTQIHYSNSWVEVYFNNERIALHKRNLAKGAYNTIAEHLSSTHQEYLKWKPEYFMNLAKPHGEAVMMFIERLFHQCDYPETGYKRAMGIVQLHREYGSERLNNACQRALSANAIKYKVVKNILKNNLDKEQHLSGDLFSTTSHIPNHKNIRGAGTYN
ncbi:MAG: IS21 family transposase [Candidatus Scalindua sp.]|nr:IS21 family transposase [Candidatus Scalindua sp.]